jgi:hypothetical protein
LIVDLYLHGMAAPPTRVRATMVLTRLEDGTLVGVAGEYASGLLLAHAQDPDFNDTLQRLRILEHTDCEKVDTKLKL